MANPNDLTILTGKTMATSFVSDPILLVRNIGFSFQITYTGSPVGIFTVASSGYSSAAPLVDIPTSGMFSTLPAPQGAVPTYASPLTLAYSKLTTWNWVQLVYTATSGSGLCTITFNGR